MLSIEECRAQLGEVADTMNDQQIIQLRDAIYAIVEPIIDESFAVKE